MKVKCEHGKTPSVQVIDNLLMKLIMARRSSIPNRRVEPSDLDREEIEAILYIYPRAKTITLTIAVLHSAIVNKISCAEAYDRMMAPHRKHLTGVPFKNVFKVRMPRRKR